MGLDGVASLRCDDPAEQVATVAVARRLAELRERERKALAVAIVNALAQAMKR